jgi:hypothetical protein
MPHELVLRVVQHELNEPMCGVIVYFDAIRCRMKLYVCVVWYPPVLGVEGKHNVDEPAVEGQVPCMQVAKARAIHALDELNCVESRYVLCTRTQVP